MQRAHVQQCATAREAVPLRMCGSCPTMSWSTWQHCFAGARCQRDTPFVAFTLLQHDALQQPCCSKQVLSQLIIIEKFAPTLVKSLGCKRLASTHMQQPVCLARRWRKPSRGFSYREVFLGAASTFTLGLVLGWLRRAWLVSLFGRFQRHRVVRVTALCAEAAIPSSALPQPLHRSAGSHVLFNASSRHLHWVDFCYMRLLAAGDLTQCKLHVGCFLCETERGPLSRRCATWSRRR